MYSWRAARIACLVWPPANMNCEPSMPIADRPNRPPVTYMSGPVRYEVYIRAMATEPASIGSAIIICCQARPSARGSSGGGSSTSSPEGYSGSGRRVARLMTAVPTLCLPPLRSPRHGQAVLLCVRLYRFHRAATLGNHSRREPRRECLPRLVGGSCYQTRRGNGVHATG